jgi:hypothetical protein
MELFNGRLQMKKGLDERIDPQLMVVGSLFAKYTSRLLDEGSIRG